MRNDAHRQDMIAQATEMFEKGKIDRRGFMQCLAMLGATAAVGGLAGKAHAETKEITLCNFGGDAIKAMGTAWGEPFTKESGVKVNIDGAGPLPGNIKKMVDEKNVIWDVSDGDAFYAFQLGPSGYLEPIDYSVVAKDKVWPGMTWEYGLANYVYSFVLVYRKSKYPTPPTSWADFFDTEKFPGKRSMWKWFTGQAEACLMGAGKSHDEVYPVDMDIVAEQIDKLGDDLVLWDSGGESQQLLIDGEVDMACMWNTRASIVERDTKGDVTWLWKDQILCPASWVVPKGVKDPATSMQFIASTQDPKSQITLLEMLGNGPANPAAQAMLTEEQKRIDPTSHQEDALLVGSEWYAENYDDKLNDWLDMVAT